MTHLRRRILQAAQGLTTCNEEDDVGMETSFVVGVSIFPKKRRNKQREVIFFRSKEVI